MLITLAMALLLGQAEAADEAPPPAAPAAAPIAPPPAAAPAEPVKPVMSNDQISRELERLKKLPPEEAAKAATDLAAKMPRLPADFGKPQLAGQQPVIPEVKDYAELPEAEQVMYSAREFFTQLIAGDARNITNNCGLPFQLEERRLQSPEELFGEWLKNLRAKRTDLLTLYDIEVLTPQDMEKKYGKPPQRLAQLPWRGQKTYVAVANLSGHAAIAVFRYTGVNWAAVGYAD